MTRTVAAALDAVGLDAGPARVADAAHVEDHGSRPPEPPVAGGGCRRDSRAAAGREGRRGRDQRREEPQQRDRKHTRKFLSGSPRNPCTGTSRFRRRTQIASLSTAYGVS